jgi:hypothetical protein
MSQTPSGNTWEPTGACAPAAGARGEAPVPPPASYVAAGEAVPAGRTSRRTRRLLAAGVAVVALAAGAGGYAVGATAGGHDGPDATSFTHQGPAPGDGFAEGDGPDGDGR